MRHWDSGKNPNRYADPNRDDDYPVYGDHHMNDAVMRCNANASLFAWSDAEGRLTKDLVDVLEVKSGDEITFHVPTILFHPGPLIGYLAKAPEAGVRGWDGSGEVVRFPFVPLVIASLTKL